MLGVMTNLSLEIWGNIVPAFLEENVYCSELAIGRSPFGFALVKFKTLKYTWVVSECSITFFR